MWVIHWENTLKFLLAAPSNQVFSHKENSPHDTNFPLWAECSVKVYGYQSRLKCSHRCVEPRLPLATLSGQVGICAYAGNPHMALAPLAGPACSSSTPSKTTFWLSPKIRPFIPLFFEKNLSAFFHSKVSHHNKPHYRGLSNVQNWNLIWAKTDKAPLIWDLGERYERH